MKNVLIIGSNSYIGSSLEGFLNESNDGYNVTTIDVKNPDWHKISFCGITTIVHVAGIAHIKETRKNEKDFFAVNRDLAITVAKKAKAEGVKHFVYISSMSVYGINRGVIGKDTPLNPNTSYGRSKLLGERGIQALESSDFKVTIVRPPIVYGKGCKGNYKMLSKLVQSLCFFPITNNVRSMLYIENLCIYLKKLIDLEIRGIILPQNAEPVKIVELVKLIAEQHGKRIMLLNISMRLLNAIPINSLQKLFCSLIYENDSNPVVNVNELISFRETIWRTETK